MNHPFWRILSWTLIGAALALMLAIGAIRSSSLADRLHDFAFVSQFVALGLAVAGYCLGRYSMRPQS